MKNQITLKSKHVVEAFCGGESLGTFEITSEWNGMAEMKSESGTIIVNRQEGLMRGLQGLLGMDETVEVVKASPELGAKILQANDRTLATRPAPQEPEKHK